MGKIIRVGGTDNYRYTGVKLGGKGSEARRGAEGGSGRLVGQAEQVRALEAAGLDPAGSGIDDFWSGLFLSLLGFSSGLVVKNLLAVQETRVQSLGQPAGRQTWPSSQRTRSSKGDLLRQPCLGPPAPPPMEQLPQARTQSPLISVSFYHTG